MPNSPDWFTIFIGGGVLFLVVVYSFLKYAEGGDDDG